HTHYFADSGLQQYQDWLTAKNILKTLQSGQYAVSTVVQETPTLLNEGAVNGRYRWLYEVPIMITYLPRGASSYQNLTPATQKITLLIEVAGMDKANAAQSVVIDRWSDRNAADLSQQN